jgi:group I intron endonuclease
LKDNKNKIGIYRWVNTINNKTYIGSAVSTRDKLYRYYNKKDLERNYTMPICRAIFKYGYKNFNLEILVLICHYLKIMVNGTYC